MQLVGIVPYTGFYINLDRSTRRRQEVEQQLESHGLSPLYRRFAAVDGRKTGSNGHLSAGERGCFLSHYQALKAAHGEGKAVHILEDDVLLSEYVGDALKTGAGSALFDHFDVLHTDTFVHIDLGHLTWYLRRFDEAARAGAGRRPPFHLSVLDLSQRSLATTSSYIVGPRAVGRLLDFFDDEIRNGMRLPFDLFLRKLADCNALRFGCLFPFLTSVRLDRIFDNTIGDRPNQTHNPALMVAALLRHAFFVKRDLPGYARPYYETIFGPYRESADPYDRLVADALALAASGQLKAF
jgi:GR25 family glycosyltransferase involved in LPS biosynthesis